MIKSSYSFSSILETPAQMVKIRKYTMATSVGELKRKKETLVRFSTVSNKNELRVACARE